MNNVTFNYISIFVSFYVLFLTGITIFKRVTTERRIEVLLPAGTIFGVCLYIFLLNFTAHFIKGTPGFWLAFCFQILLAFASKRFFPSLPLIFPKQRERKIWILLLLLWALFLYQITAHATTDGADSTLHQSFAARFIRGDYPIHTPWQPDYIGFYHYGGAELLGSLHALTGTPYYFLHPFIAFLMLLSVSQILTWIMIPEKKSFISIVSFSLPAITGLISLGGFFIAWPSHFTPLFPLSHFPTLGNAFENYGSPTNLDALVFFLHRFLAVSFLTSLFILLFYPKKNLLSYFSLAIFLAAIALTDESVFLITIIPILIIGFFNIFNKSIKIFSLSVCLFFLLILFQGGIITESFLNRYNNSDVLLFPSDQPSVTEKYLSYRLTQQKSRFYPASENLTTLSWFHPGIIWQLMLFLIFVIVLSMKSSNKKMKILLWILLLSAVISLVAFFGLVPKGYTHPNGNRFLALSYYLSGLGLAYLCSYWFNQTNKIPRLVKYPINLFIFWILLTSIVPPFMQLFPRKKDNWFIIKPQTVSLTNNWIKNNLPADKRIVALTEINPSNSMNMNLVKEAGVLTPVWMPTPRVHDSFDISPGYADLHYTLNPSIISTLKIDYILINNVYFSQLPKQRQQDLLNMDFFVPVFSSNNFIILYIKPKFLVEAKNFKGTYNELDQIAPLKGAYCLDYPPNISEHTYRILKLLLYNRKTYCDHGGAFYNARIDISLNPSLENPDKYDFLVLGTNIDPQSFCHCQATLLWEGLGNNLKLWKTY